VYANEEYIGEVLKQGKIWDYSEIFNTLMPFISHNKDILDIGSHIGCHAIPYARKTSGTVHCFDAQKEMYELLLDNVEMNKLKNVKAYNVAVGHEDGITVSIASTMPDGSA
jgi:cyclopropane fatty-acyl-phospholipid synthase-like methyltransferase